MPQSTPNSRFTATKQSQHLFLGAGFIILLNWNFLFPDFAAKYVFFFDKMRHSSMLTDFCALERVSQ